MKKIVLIFLISLFVIVKAEAGEIDAGNRVVSSISLVNTFNKLNEARDTLILECITEKKNPKDILACIKKIDTETVGAVERIINQQKISRIYGLTTGIRGNAIEEDEEKLINLVNVTIIGRNLNGPYSANLSHMGIITNEENYTIYFSYIAANQQQKLIKGNGSTFSKAFNAFNKALEVDAGIGYRK